MGKKTKPIRSKLSGSVILSTVLHLLIIALLIWGSLTQKWNLGGGGGSDGQVIDAIMVDPNAVVQEYNQQKAQQANVQKAEQERKARAQQQEEELRQQQIKEQERLKALEVERLQAKEVAEAQRREAATAAAKAKEEQKQAEEAAAQAKAERDRILKEQADAKAKAEAEAKKQAELAAKQKAEEAKAKAEAEAKAKAEADAKAKAAAEAKAKAAAEAKAKAAAQQQSKAVDSLLDGLVAQGDKQSGASAAGQGGGNRSGANAAGIDRYTGQVKVAIEQKFFDSDLYKGRKCDLKISIAPDGMLVSAKAVGGDPALCQVALQAAKMATLPKPPKDIYEQVKSPTIEFKP
ncbi:cell envelope integrity protein TolA [Proteus mirabilis]|uniref:cell envelope integrity protein TolA n=1 Tax=Proteus mirabilis TaxID=584 RepID=UPI0021BA59F3|nr:cell envelope integrity protein TolA [Proteus mirabilis]MCT8223792.1 cell envelope integrity protein TolA [Proteus mirabilis]MDF7224715.1 cell envelope integrity protein TolA [Proteus mirabilis]MDF7263295.1 cell envelope integrity protein TolA [Proteus mirabilis]MDF7310471.1 cell envelope integrity protein TolA [Proteus mirabilis]MDF7364626.1 cell envelope integrity protein TolA [Proteus mirabilis]